MKVSKKMLGVCLLVLACNYAQGAMKPGSVGKIDKSSLVAPSYLIEKDGLPMSQIVQSWGIKEGKTIIWQASTDLVVNDAKSVNQQASLGQAKSLWAATNNLIGVVNRDNEDTPTLLVCQGKNDNNIILIKDGRRTQCDE